MTNGDDEMKSDRIYTDKALERIDAVVSEMDGHDPAPWDNDSITRTQERERERERVRLQHVNRR